MLTLLLLGTFIFAFNVGLVRAQAETVTINSDGSVSPSDAPISSVDNVTYTFTSNMSYPTYNGIVVERNNTIIDGNGYTLQGEYSGLFGTGISLMDTSNVTIENANVEDWNYAPIYLQSSSNNTVIRNNVTTPLGACIILDSSSNNIIIGNDANAGVGIVLISSSNNTVSGNNVTGSQKCILLESSSNNTTYHNNFIGNVVHASVDSASGGNAWDDGYSSGGNYWSDYNGTDLYSGPYQNVTGSDGIGDTPYVIDANNADHYPSMEPLLSSVPPQAAFTYAPSQVYDNMTVIFDASSSSAEGYNSTLTQYAWTINDPNNQTNTVQTTPTLAHVFVFAGTYVVTLNVTTSQGLWSTASKPVIVFPDFGPTANFTWTPARPIASQTVTFDASSSQPGWSGQISGYANITSYTWNFGDGTTVNTTSNSAIQHTFEGAGNYIVSLTVTDFISRTNEIIQNLNVSSRLLGDLNGDGRVDMKDIAIAAAAFESSTGSPDWNPVADVNGDGKVDMKDIAMVVAYFGWSK